MQWLMSRAVLACLELVEVVELVRNSFRIKELAKKAPSPKSNKVLT